MLIKSKQKFSQSFNTKGYKELQPISLVPPADDKSVLFTTATITAFKSELLKSSITEKKFLNQHCLRLHNTNKTLKPGFYPELFSYFNMFGGVVPYKTESDLIFDIKSCFINDFKLNPDNLVIYAASQDSCWIPQNINLPVIYDSAPSKFYKWTYGMPNIFGRGITFGYTKNLKQKDPTILLPGEIGQVIQLCDNNNKTLGYEFAFGIEVLLALINGKEDKITYTSAYQTIKAHNLNMLDSNIRNIADMVSILGGIYSTDIIADNKTPQGSILRQNIRKLIFLKNRVNMSLEQVYSLVEYFYKIEFNESLPARCYQDINVMDKLVEKQNAVFYRDFNKIAQMSKDKIIDKYQVDPFLLISKSR